MPHDDGHRAVMVVNARLAYTIVGIAIGVSFPVCALVIAHMSSGANASADIGIFILQAHAAQALYYVVDGAPLLLGLLGYLAGHRLDITSAVASSLRDEATQRTQTLQRLAGDIAARKQLQDRLNHQTFHDGLTNLANRALFTNRTEHALTRAGSRASSVAVFLLDLDDFKTINDTLGHDAGNALLVAAAARFGKIVRPFDTLARLGGDEFGVLIERVSNHHEAVTLGHALINALAVPITLGSRHIRIGASLGIAFGRADATAQTLLRDAELAMYEAKSRGKDMLRVFRPDMHSALVERVAIGSDLQRALRLREFHLLYQPIMNLANQRIVGMEALVRWNHPRRGVISPADFIKIAEDTSSIIPLGAWILRAACRQMVMWQHVREDAHALTLTVNVSPLQLKHAGFLADVRAALNETGLSPQQLVLEITESALVDDSPEILAIFGALKALGVRLAIDDFGTGYSSLSYLQRFPFDILKIDKAFVDGVAGGGSDAAFARTIIALGGMLKLRVLAEGIEHATQFAMLRELGCELGQGYFFAKPLEASAMTSLLESPAMPITAAAAA